MSQVAELYARWLADYYLLATILLALSLIGIALQKQPARRLAIAKSTLVSVVLLAVLCAIPGWSVVHLLTEQQPQPVAEFHDEIPVQPVVMAEPIRSMVTDAPPIVHEDAAAPVVNNDPLPEPSIDFHLSWPALFAMTHLGGAACIVLWLTLGWIASARLRRTAQSAPTDLVAVLNQVFGQTQVSTQCPQLLTHERIDVAVALGAWRPTILLPGRWIRSESQDHLRTVLAHESTHILNHDLQWVALTRMIFIALWANPLFWITRRWLRRDQEALADAAAAELTSRQRYAEQLVAWARDAHRRPALHLSSAVGLWEGPSQLRQRIAILLNDRFIVLRNCSRRWRLAAALILIAGATALSLVTIQPGQSQAAAKGAEPTAPDAPTKPTTGTLTMRFEYDGTPPAPKERKEYGWRNKLDDRDLGTFNIEKTVGVKVFDESLVVSKDRGIANIFVYMRGKNIPNVATVDSVPHHFDKQRGTTVPDKYKGPPATLSYRKGRYEPHALAFEWPRQLVLRNDDPKPVTYINYTGKASTDPMLKPGAERALEVRPELPIPIKMAGNPLQWLEAYVLPLGHPFFAVSDEHGNIRIDNLPPGKWEFQVWHERCGYVKIKNWTKGRFTLDVKPGDNDLGIVKLGPELFHEPEPSPPVSTTSTNTPGEKQGGSAAIPDEAWGKPVNGLRAALVIKDPPIDIYDNLAYDVVVENVSDHDIRFAVAIHHIYGFNSIEFTDTDGKQVPQQQPDIIQSFADPPKLVRFSLKPKERTIISPLTAKLVELDKNGNPAKPRSQLVVNYFDLKPGPYSVSVTAELGPEIKNIEPVTKITEELSPKPDEWTGKLQTGKVRVALFENAKPNSHSTNAAVQANPAELSKNAPVPNANNPGANSIRAIAENEGQQPILGAQAFLFRVSQRDATRVLVDRKTTNEKGEFRFDNVVDIAQEFPGGKFPPLDEIGDELLQVIVISPNRVPYSYLQVPQRIAQSGEFRRFNMWTAAPLSGRITSRDGKPVVGALVSVGTGSFDRWEGALSARTDADGNYTINDAPPFDLQKYRDEKTPAFHGQWVEATLPTASGVFAHEPPVLTIEHPDFAAKQTDIEYVPGKKDVQLEPGMVITGRVVYSDTREPAAGVRVCAAATSLLRFSRAVGLSSSIGDPHISVVTPSFMTTVRTDSSGNYHFSPLPWSTYEVWAETPVYIGTSAKDVVAPRGASKAVADLALSKGGTLSVRLIDAQTRKPIEVSADTRAEIYEYGSHRRGGFIAANKQGRFDLHLAPGKHEFRIADVVGREARWNGYSLNKDRSTTVNIIDGQTAQVDMPVNDISGIPLVDAKVLAQLAEKPLPVAAKEKSDKSTSPDNDKKSAAKPPRDPLFDLYRKNFKLPDPNTVGGFIVDDKLQPLPQAKVYLYRHNLRDSTRKLVAEKSPDANGKVRFDHVFDLAKEFPNGRIPPLDDIGEELLLVIVRAPERVTQSHMQPRQMVAMRGDPLLIVMPPATTLRGRVTSPDGKPVTAAIVSISTGWMAAGAEAMSARTDADGNYTIDDVPPFNLKTREEEEAKIRNSKEPTATFRASPPFLTLIVKHPDFAVGQAQIEKTPGTLDVQLKPGTVLTGRVMLADSGKPAAGARVLIAGHAEKLSQLTPTKQPGSDVERHYANPLYTASTHADADGKYRFASLPTGFYHIVADMPDWVSVGLRDVSATPDWSAKAPDLTLTKGGTVSIRLVDAKTREPVKIPPESLAVFGKHELPIYDRPPTQGTIPANKDGQFELRLPAGKHEIYISSVNVGEQRKWVGAAASQNLDTNVVVTVTEGKSVQVDMPVIDANSAKVTGTFGIAPLPKEKPKEPASDQKTPDETPNNKSTQISRPPSQPNVVSGRVTDEKGQPIAGAEAVLFRINRIGSSRKLQATKATDADGRYRFENVVDIPKEFPDGKLSPINPLEEEYVQVYVRAAGRVAGMGMEFRPQVARVGDVFDMTLKPAATLTGRVTGPDGKPVAGAIVSIGDSGFSSWDEVGASRTKADGTYAINDAAPYGIDEYRKQAEARNRQTADRRAKKLGLYSFHLLPPMLTVKHPDFAVKQSIYMKIPGAQNVTLDQGATLDGRIIYEDSAKPAVGVIVHLATSMPPDASPGTDHVFTNYFAADAYTDAGGKYHFASLPAGNYNLSAEIPGWVNTGRDRLTAEKGKTTVVPDLTLTKGGIISIRLIDDKTGEPIALTSDTRANISAHQFPLGKGNARASTIPYAAANSAGRFELHALPGKRAVFASFVQVGDQLKWMGKNMEGQSDPILVDVANGKTVEVDLPVKEMNEAKAAATYGRLKVAPAAGSQPQPKAKASPDGAANKGAEAAPPKPEKAPAVATQQSAPTELVGLVVGPDGSVLSDVTVDAFTWYPGNETKTNAQGQFRLKGFDKNSNVEIEFRKKGFGPRHFNVQRTGTPGWIVQMDNTTYLEGLFVDPKGESVPNALIRADRKALNEYVQEIGEVYTDVRTDQNGHYRLYLEPDTYNIKVRAPGRGVARYDKQKIEHGQQKLFNINLEDGITFRAVVKDSLTGKPMQGIMLFHYQHKGTEGTSNAEGIVEVPSMFPGNFEFNVTAVDEDRMRTSVAGNYARWWSPEALKPYQREFKGEGDGFQRNFDGLEFDIAEGANPATIFVEPCVTITGRVIDPNGKPVAGATATLARTGTGNSLAGDTRFSYTTKKDGTFEIKAPSSDPVKYNLIAHDGVYDQWRNWANATGEPFATKPGDKIENVELRLIRPATIRGRVLANQKTPVPDKEVRAADALGHDNRYYVPTTKSDAKGNFELKFVAPGRRFVQLANTLDPKDAAADTSTIVDVKEGETIENILIGAGEPRRY